MKNERINALIMLLDDPSDEIFNSVEGELLKEEVVIVSQLERAWESTQDDLCQHRIENIIHNLQLKDLRNRLKTWKSDPEKKLLEGAWLVARYQYPELDFDEIDQTINRLRKDVWLEISEHFTALEKVRIINHILFDVHGFGRNKSRLMAPQNSFICDVLDTRKGNPISLSVIYSLVAQRLGLPVYGVNLPRNFLLAYLDDSALNNKELFSNPQSVLFYINPINKGAVLGRKEIDSFIQQQKLEPNESFLVPCSNQDTVLRLFKNLLLAYEGMGLPLKCAEIKEFISILDE